MISEPTMSHLLIITMLIDLRLIYKCKRKFTIFCVIWIDLIWPDYQEIKGLDEKIYIKIKHLFEQTYTRNVSGGLKNYSNPVNGVERGLSEEEAVSEFYRREFSN